ncbi:5-formyltetrahydrofolate cyclo-ligase [Priestia koreensis]|uniref:5-formyltetrahydrofolate cyclo-ligase n=1 Tax=Priestia koreensis TaxID=284581 RepID=UPI001F5A3F18|nr:5-formyltetrahydrofolate cyclo-ligase [Priestia koreensis]MCM3002479.1 5-formyltetrahydrofolate cyclo-ligase [Priestia koreensis]UNL84195.1 5-formyltetrahydrofolate cyclo-ligase [Priestia koreensis]
MKKELRSAFKARMDEMTTEELHRYSVLITERLVNSSFWENCQVIGCTISGPKEVSTLMLIEKAWEQGKDIVVPKCHPKTKEMTFHRLTSFDQLETVFYGLKEPIVEKTTKVEAAQIDGMIVPGLWFDHSGYRVGYGGGYYDRYLVHYPHRTTALAMDWQLVDSVPYEQHDVPVHQIVTNETVLYVD